MSFGMTIRDSIRAMIEGAGYWFRHRSVLPFGIEYQYDIRRMAERVGYSVEVFFDIGAHTGSTAVEVLKNFSAAKVYAFEPHPETFSVLTSKVRDPRFTAFNLALSNKDGKAQFFEYGHLATCNSLVGDNQFAMQTCNPFKVIEVECRTLDSFCKEQAIDRIDVLKIDTEGHDLSVLQGAGKALSEYGVCFVYIEFNSLLPKAGTTGGALLPISEVLEPLGFRFLASYPEYMTGTDDLFVTSNALFFRPSRAAS